MDSKQVKDQILKLVEVYHSLKTQENYEKFIPGETFINYGGRVYDEKEIKAAVNASLDFWLTHGIECYCFEEELAEYFDLKYSSLVNSGSSANLLAFMSLTSPLLKEKQIQRGDEVITVAACFPTTISPIIQYGAIPVFVDCCLSGNLMPSYLEKALSEKTKAVMVAHTLGNPLEIDIIKKFCDKNNLWLIEDNCDSFGSTYKNQLTGTLGDISTLSFYPAHHLCGAEAGAVLTNNDVLHKIIVSMRDWGRDCTCKSGEDNSCGHRFTRQWGNLPKGTDHKFIYSHLGYNLKATEFQGAILREQLKKADNFIEKRKCNWEYLFNELKDLYPYIVTAYRSTEYSDPSWFGFMIYVNNDYFTKDELVEHLENHKIQTRPLFAGNILLHPCFDDLEEGWDYRVIGDLKNTNEVLNTAFWIGVYPGMSDEKLAYIVVQIKNFTHSKITNKKG